LDTQWLDKLPQNDSLATQDEILQWLAGFISDTEPPGLQQLQVLMLVDERCRSNTALLAMQYVNATRLSSETEERLWRSVYSYSHHFSLAYQRFITNYQERSEQITSHRELPLLVARALHYHGMGAKWHYFRYEQMPEGGWLQLHMLYILAEQEGFADKALQLFPDGEETSCSALYLQVLMLETPNRTNMTKKEINLVDEWLVGWSRLLPLQRQFEQEQQLFYVDLSEDRGGRRIRNFEPTPNCRYWDTGPVATLIEQAKASLQQGKHPAGFDSGRYTGSDVDCPGLFEHLLTEWSRDAYRRQRRTDERGEVKKVAEAIHGIFGVCQHVKNVMFVRDRGISIAGDMGMSGIDGEDANWTIENESLYGFGAVVDPESNTWLKVGKLIALDYEKNKDMTVIGVVRSIKQLPERKCYLGIEVLSHTPTYVLLRGSVAKASPGEQSAEVFLVSTLTFEGMPSFPGLYLSRDEERKVPSTLIIPAIEFSGAGMFELRMDNCPYLIRIGSLVEQKDDWARVEVNMVSKGTRNQ